MKVKDLIKELQKLPPNMEVLCDSDAEGNRTRSLAGVQTGAYEKDGYEYEVIYDEATDDMSEKHTHVVVYPV